MVELFQQLAKNQPKTITKKQFTPCCQQSELRCFIENILGTRTQRHEHICFMQINPQHIYMTLAKENIIGLFV